MVKNINFFNINYPWYIKGKDTSVNSNLFTIEGFHTHQIPFTKWYKTEVILRGRLDKSKIIYEDISGLVNKD